MKELTSLPTTSDIQQPALPTTIEMNMHSSASSWLYYIYCEILKALRDPFTLMFSIAFPAFYFLLFGGITDARFAPAMLAMYAGYGVFTVGFQNFSMVISSERIMGWNRLLRTTSLSAALYLTAKFVMIVLTGVLSLVVLFAVSSISGRVHMGLTIWAELFGAMLLAMAPCILIGLFLGLVGSSSFTRIFSIVFGLVLSFGSGLLLPLQLLPEFVRTYIAPYTPTYHIGQLGLKIVNLSVDDKPIWFHLLWLLGYSLLFLVLCAVAYRRDEGKNYS